MGDKQSKVSFIFKGWESWLDLVKITRAIPTRPPVKQCGILKMRCVWKSFLKWYLSFVTYSGFGLRGGSHSLIKGQIRCGSDTQKKHIPLWKGDVTMEKLKRQIKKTWKNKAVALLLFIIGLITLMIENDCTVLIFVTIVFVVPLWLAKCNKIE